VGAFDHLVDEFWECYSALVAGPRAETSQACVEVVEDVDTRVAAGDGDSFHLLVALAEAAPDDQGLAYLGAGPLEELIRDRWRDAVVVDRVEGWARRSDRFRLALACVWYSDSVPDEVQQRLTNAASSS
jgi:hypothetical protein